MTETYGIVFDPDASGPDLVRRLVSPGILRGRVEKRALRTTRSRSSSRRAASSSIPGRIPLPTWWPWRHGTQREEEFWPVINFVRDRLEDQSIANDEPAALSNVSALDIPGSWTQLLLGLPPEPERLEGAA
jgi:hypothetical protein